MSRPSRATFAVLAMALLLTALLGATALPGRARVAAGVAAARSEAWDEALGAFLPRGTTRPSATALYDAGTVWHLRGDAARALACWRAAREQAPRSDDLAHDIALARSELPDAPPPVPPRRPWMEVVTPGELGLFVALVLAGLSLAAVRERRTGARLLLAGAYVGALGAGWVALDGRSALLHEPIGVTVDEAVARDAPSLDAGERHALARGAELRALQRRGAFVLVVDGMGRRGWVSPRRSRSLTPRACRAVPGNSAGLPIRYGEGRTLPEPR